MAVAISLRILSSSIASLRRSFSCLSLSMSVFRDMASPEAARSWVNSRDSIATAPGICKHGKGPHISAGPYSRPEGQVNQYGNVPFLLYGGSPGLPGGSIRITGDEPPSAYTPRSSQKTENGYVSLLDEKMKIVTIGKMSESLVECVIDNVEENAYRKAAQNVSKLTGQTISHEGARNVIQAVGEII